MKKKMGTAHWVTTLLRRMPTYSYIAIPEIPLA